MIVTLTISRTVQIIANARGSDYTYQRFSLGLLASKRLPFLFVLVMMEFFLFATILQSLPSSDKLMDLGLSISCLLKKTINHLF